MKIALVYCLHGDEKETEEIAKYFDNYLDFMNEVKIFLGNPKLMNRTFVLPKVI